MKTIILDWFQLIPRNELPDLWTPFTIAADGEDTTISDTPEIEIWADPQVTSNGHWVDTFGAASEWEPVTLNKYNGPAGDVNHPSETIDSFTLLGLEPGTYQCVIVDMSDCEECEEHEDCDCDLMVGWALMKLDED